MTNRLAGIEETFTVAKHRYDIVETFGGYSVRLTLPDGKYIYLREPESTYETPSGARYAVLLDLETRLDKVNHVSAIQRVK